MLQFYIVSFENFDLSNMELMDSGATHFYKVNIYLQVDNKNHQIKRIYRRYGLKFKLQQSKMIKSRHPLFNKTITKHEAKHTLLQPFEYTKNRYSNLKFPKTNQNLTHIIKDLEKNVRQLKLYHQSLQKTRSMRLQKSSSVNQIQKLKKSNTTLKNTTKSILTFKRPSTLSNITKNNQRLTSSSTYPQRQQNQTEKNVIIESTISKCPILQNGSTILSIHNADIDEVKRAYLLTHGKNTSNIVDLYNFFKKNVEKSTRIHGSTYLAEHQPENEQDMMKSHLYRKSSEIMNVIVQDKVGDDVPRNLSSQSQSIYKISAQKNPVMEQIFKNGCPDLANVYEYVQKRRVSIKNYMNLNKKKQTQELNKQNNSVSINCNKLQSASAKKTFQAKQVQEIRIPPQISQQIQSKKLTQKKLPKTNIEPLISSPILRMSSIHNESPIGSPQLSQNKYLPSISSKKSQKSSLKKSKQKQVPINLDANILQNDEIINQFESQNEQFLNPSAEKKQQNCQKHVQNKLFDEEFFRQLNNSQEIEMKQQKFKKSKYYVEPIPVSKQKKQIENSLEGCEISVKSSSRIIQLDFIPLDL